MDDRGDVSIQGFWEPQTVRIFDTVVTNLDAKSYRTKAPATVLRQKEATKKRHYLPACLAQQRHFTPLSFSADGLYGREADAFMKRMASLLARKWQHPYSHICGWVKGCMAITIT